MRRRFPIQCIDVEDAGRVLRRPDVLVIDVRDRPASDRGRIACARHVTISNLSAIISGTAKRRPILIYCFHGCASREYAQVLSDFGFHEVYSLGGDFEAWRDKAQPAVASRRVPEEHALQP